MTFGNFKIPMKLLTVFAVLIATIAAMGCALYANNVVFEQSVRRASAAQETLRVVDAARFRLTRQENSLRGYLLSNDPYYVGRLKSHRGKFFDAVTKLKRLAGSDPQALARIAVIETAYGRYDVVAIEPALKLAADPVTRPQAVALVRNDGVADRAVQPVEDAIQAVDDADQAILAAEAKAQAVASLHSKFFLMFGIGLSAAIALGGGILLSRAIAGPVASITAVMRRLASGDNAVEVPAIGRGDEVGQMAAAVLTFKEAAIAKQRLELDADQARLSAERERAANDDERRTQEAEQTAVVDRLAEGLSKLAQGDLTCRIDANFDGRYRQLRDDFNQAVAKLQDVMASIVAATDGVSNGSDEIARASDDLSRRTEQQAASLEETAAALDEITVTVRKTAGGAEEASGVVAAARADAEHSGRIVGEAVEAMTRIEDSSRQVSQIIGVIDEIAFQTNLLALNAGVEAARAGEAGRGFAVVASEVRALAQRSADAAKEIKTLISTSTQQVGQGVSLVGQTGDALNRIVERVAAIDGLVTEIAASAQEQASGLNEVNTAVNQMDQVVQQNAAMVEEATAATHSLKSEATELATLVGRFQIGAGAPARRPAAAPPARGPGVARAGRGSAVAVAARDDWEEF
jgi:methyl-accepting chemotaxis protein